MTPLVSYALAIQMMTAVAEDFIVFPIDADAAVFKYLVSQWRRRRGVTSSTTVMGTCPAYQKIIGMGKTAIPHILREMENEGDDPDMWFWALQAITRVDPVPAEDRGDVKRMADAWLSWARKVGYAW